MAKHATIAPLPKNPPALDGVEHRWITTPSGLKIHVALAGPEGGSPVMLVHGFPQHWWEWRHQIGPLAADGFGPRLLGQSDGRYLRMVCQWVGGDFRWTEENAQLFLGQMQDPARPTRDRSGTARSRSGSCSDGRRSTPGTA